jgi:hypothetical protein
VNDFTTSYSIETIISSDEIPSEDKIHKLKEIPNRILINGRPVNLNNNHDEIRHIYKALLIAYNSDWHNNLAEKAKICFYPFYISFLKWLENYEVTNDNKFKILKDYEAYRVNECGVKPQSTGIGHLTNLMNVGISSDAIEPETLRYITLLLHSTTASSHEEKNQITLTGFFTSIPWLRPLMSESDYLRLESPKRLMDSFSITIATILLHIINTKYEYIEIIKTLSSNNYLSKEINAKHKLDLWCRDIFFNICDTNTDDMTAININEIMNIDFINSDYWDELCRQIKAYREGKSRNKGVRIKLDNKYVKPYATPDIFHFENINTPSKIEQILFSWLCAWLAIQPSDIPKLKKNNFVIHRNYNGHPTSIQCQYYKGRSGIEHSTPIISAKQIEGQCILAFLDGIKDSSQYICANINLARMADAERSSPTYRLKRLFQSDIFKKIINIEIAKRSSSHIFMNAFNCMTQNGSKAYGAWKKDMEIKGKNHSISDYRKSVERPLPDSLFGLASIKTSSVHARSDLYRSGDLINQNSHSNETEKLHYLSDSNKDWVNQNGRITRLVLNDMNIYSFKPNINRSVIITNDLMMRTKKVELSDFPKDNSPSISTSGQTKTLLFNERFEPDSIIVIDSVETVIVMLHYISEVERQYEALIEKCLPFFEMTALPTSEWMHHVLNQMLTPSIVNNGRVRFESIKEILPPLFSPELNAGVAS